MGVRSDKDHPKMSIHQIQLTALREAVRSPGEARPDSAIAEPSPSLEGHADALGHWLLEGRPLLGPHPQAPTPTLSGPDSS